MIVLGLSVNNDLQMPLRDTWDLINKSLKDNTKKTPYQIRLAAERRFAGVILRWMNGERGRSQIRLNGISDNLIYSLKNDKNKFSLHLERYHTIPQSKAKGNQSFKWGLNRRYFQLLLAAIGGPHTLVKSMLPKEHRGGTWLENISSLDIDSSLIDSYNTQKKTGKILLNMPSLFKTPVNLRYLARWWIDEKCFENKNYDKNKPYVTGIDSPATPPRLYPRKFHYVPAGFDTNGNAITLSPMEFLQQKHDEISKQSKDGLDRKENDAQNMRRIKRAFTSKFRPWLVEKINTYWFRVMVVEEENHRTRRSFSRKYVTSSYEKFTLCLIIVAWFRNANEFQSKGMGLNLKLHSRFVEKFPSSECHFKTAKDYVKAVTEQIKTGSETTPTIKANNKCSDCRSELEIQELSIKRMWDFSLVCPNCGLVDDDEIFLLKPIKTNRGGEYTTSKMSELKKPSGGRRKKDWEMKIYNEKNWVFNHSHIDDNTKKIIDNEISKNVESIKRYKNQN